MSEVSADRVEQLRQQALAKIRVGELEEALPLYDEALALTEDEETRELLTINKADTLIALELPGREIQALPAILMRRRNLHHTFLAAYALMYKHRLRSEISRGIFYGQLALDVALEAGQALWHIGALNELGSLYEMDSQFDKAIESFQNAIQRIGELGDPENHKLTEGAALQNLGSSKMLKGDYQEGITLIEAALPSIVSPAHMAEAYIDLCYGYLAIDQLERAAYFGLEGLALANEPRQVRNAHYLLGEVAYQMNDVPTAERHFDELAKLYPEFRNLKNLLFAVDLRGMINLKL